MLGGNLTNNNPIFIYLDGSAAFVGIVPAACATFLKPDWRATEAVNGPKPSGAIHPALSVDAAAGPIAYGGP